MKKRKNIRKMQNGGDPKDPAVGPITFLNSYYESPEFKKRFLLRNSEKDYSDQIDVFNKYKSEYKPFVFKDLNHYGANKTKRQGFDMEGVPQGTNIVLGPGDEDLSDGAGGMNSILNSALPHEYGHLMRNMSFRDQLATGELNKNQNEFVTRVSRYLDYVKNNPGATKKREDGTPEMSLSRFIIKDTGFYGVKPDSNNRQKLDEAYSKNHDAAPTEQYSDLNSLRWLMYKEGIYDSRKGDMKMEDLKKALDNKNINRYFEVKRLQEHFSPEDIIKFNNTVAANNPGQDATAEKGATMKVKPKNLFYNFLPSRKDKKKLMADSGAAVGNGPVDPRIKNMVKTLPDNYFDIFGRPSIHPPGLEPIPAQGPQPITAPAPQGAPQPDPGSYNPGIHNPPHHTQWGHDALTGMMAFDALIPREKIHNQRVIRPQEGYQPYPYGTGSQALADGGPVQDGGKKPIPVSDPKDPRLQRYNDSLSVYNSLLESTNFLKKPSTTPESWQKEISNFSNSPGMAAYERLMKVNGKAMDTHVSGTRVFPGYESIPAHSRITDKPTQPYYYEGDKSLDRSKVNSQRSDQKTRNNIQGGSPSSSIEAGGKTNFSFSGRDQQGQQVTRYFPDMDSWRRATNELPYSHTETGEGYAHATGVGNQFDDGGWMMNPMRDTPIIIPEGVADNSPMARRGFQIPIARTLQYENLPEAAGGYQIKNDVVHMKELPTQKQMENRMEKAKDGKWIQKAVNPKHKGYCTPMTKSTCTPRRKALARTFKKHHGFHKKEDGGLVEDLLAYGGIIPDNMSNFSPHEYAYGGTARGGSDSIDMLENIFFHPSSQDMAGYRQGGSMRGGSDTPDMLENIFFHPSSADMAGFDMGGSMRGGSDTTDMLENIFFHPSSADMKAKNGKTLSRSKAREMLHDGTAQGHKLTDRQRKYFGAVASGYAAMGLPVPGGDSGPGSGPKYTSNDRKDVEFLDDVNYTLASGTRRHGLGYTPEQQQLMTSAYLWRQQNAGKNPEQIIQSFYQRPTTQGNPVDDLRQRINTIGHGAAGQYQASPDIDLQQRQGNTNQVGRKEPMLSFKQGGVMYDDGGNVQTMWGGNVEHKAYNPYDGGTMQFNGASHENGGIGMQYNGNPVEVEGGETASRDSQGNLNIYGNMYLPGTRTKFKSIAKEMAQKEKSYDGLRTRGAELVNNSNPADKFEKLAFNAGKAMMAGGTIGQKDLAEKKENLAMLQRAMLDTADEHGLDAQEMSKGNIKKAKKGAKARGGAYIPFAEDGLTTDNQGGPNDPTRADRNKNPGNIKYGDWAKAHGAIGKDSAGFAIFQDRNSGELAMRSLLQSKSYNNMSVKDAIHKWTDGHPYRHDLGGLENKRVGDLSQEEFDNVIEGMKTGEGTRYGTARAKVPVKPLPAAPAPPQIPYTPLRLPDVPLHPDQPRPTPPGANPPPLDHLNIPGRPDLPTNAKPLQLEEVLPELYAAATNKVEPVPMQQYRPEQYTPYQVSFQDRLNQNQNSFNALQRTLGVTNPNALGALAAQKYSADNSVKGEEFRTNQAISNDITNRNISLMNDAQLKNLGIADTQYERQEGARAKTREYNQMILNSLSSKYAQNKLENNRLKVYENLYDYRFMPTEQGGLQATYLGPNATFNFNQTPTNKQNAQDVRTVSTYDAQGNLKNYRTYDDSRLKEAKDAIQLEEQRRKLPLLTVPPL